MSLDWLQPQAWWGLTALAVPVLIHLLTRARSRRLAFPTLRFLRQVQVSAFKQRTINDPLLLVVRMLILAAAVAALAAPVLVSNARRAEWDRRVARAVVLVGEAGDDAQALAAEERADAAFAETFANPQPADALTAALEWLRGAPPASRELVIAGDLRQGQVTRSDIDRVPANVGIRVLPLPAKDEADGAAIPDRIAVADVRGVPQGLTLTVAPEPGRTTATYAPAPVELPVAVVATPEQQPHAESILRAVLRDGLILPPLGTRQVEIVFEGAPQSTTAISGEDSAPWTRDALAQVAGARGGMRDGRFVIMLPMAATDTRAPDAVARVLAAAYAQPLDDLEPRRIPAATLAAWERPRGPAPDDVPAVDEGDRRWLWGLALVLLGVEQWLRREKQVAREQLPVEARVA